MPRYRSLADQFRAWPAERLSRLLVLRPDLATPAPHDSGQLAARAATRTSLLRALDQLDCCELSVLDAQSAAGQTTLEQLGSLVNAGPESVTEAIESLQDRALIWCADGGSRVLTGVAELLRAGPGTSGVGPFSSQPRPRTAIAASLASLSAGASAALRTVDAHGGRATSATARTDVTPDQAASPIEELLARGLLLPAGGDSLILPGEVAVEIRGGHTTTDRVDLPPELPATARDQARIDQRAAGAAFDLVRHVELVLESWDAAPPAALRNGGLAVRDLRAAATLLHQDVAAAALHIEVAAAAGLISTAADDDGTPRWIPTDAYEDWLSDTPARRWRRLARAWLTMPRVPAWVGTPDAAGKAYHALVPDLVAPGVAESRRMSLDSVATLGPGQALAAGTGAAAVLARVAWLRPRRPRQRADQVAWALREAPTIGLLADGGVPSFARSLLSGQDPVPDLDPLLPEPVSQVLVQADLTAVAPGPLRPELSRRLQTVATAESHGGAGVFRFTPESVRRGFSLGWAAPDLHAFLASISATPVPQPLTYLVDDVARTAGTLRAGYAAAYLRTEEPEALTELLAQPAAESLGLRRIAPTVVLTGTPLDQLLPRLRELGLAPTVEDQDGVVRIGTGGTGDRRRARTPREVWGEHARSDRDAAHQQARVAAVLTRLRSGDAEYVPAAAGAPSDLVARLAEAADAGDTVVLDHVDRRGDATETRVVPLSVDAGELTARAAGGREVYRFSIARVRSVRPDRRG